MSRWLLFTLGWLCVGLGIMGYLLPMMPGTVFMLLAAWCFSRSSQRFHQWLRGHRWFGASVCCWEDYRSIPKGVRPKALVVLWVGLVVSCMVAANLTITLLLVLIGVCISAFLWRLPVVDQWPLEPEKPSEPPKQY